MEDYCLFFHVLHFSTADAKMLPVTWPVLSFQETSVVIDGTDHRPVMFSLRTGVCVLRGHIDIDIIQIFRAFLDTAFHPYFCDSYGANYISNACVNGVSMFYVRLPASSSRSYDSCVCDMFVNHDVVRTIERDIVLLALCN